MRFKYLKLSLFLLVLWSINVFALSFPINSPQQRFVGRQTKMVQIIPSDTFSSVAERFDLGYYSLFEANPNIDPDNPLPGSILLLPAQYILPKTLELDKDNIVINLAELRLYYYSAKQKKVYIFPVGIGREGWETPIGHFHVIKKIVHPTWFVPLSIRKYRQSIGEPVKAKVEKGANNPLGDYALRLSNVTYLIHGTDDPVGIGRRSSAGCIRMYPPDIKKLFSMVDQGIAVTIVNKAYKACVVNGKLYFEAHLPLYEQRLKYHGDLAAGSKVVKEEARAHNSAINEQQVLQFSKEHLGLPRLLSSHFVSKPIKSNYKVTNSSKVNIEKLLQSANSVRPK